jgi:ABC-type transporter Mla subunit MlaD
VRRPFSRPAQAHVGPPDPSRPAPDERVWGRNYRGPSPWIWGLLIVVLLSIGSYLAYTKELPWSSPAYEITATFENSATLRTSNPVRIAGVNVGKVTDVELDGDLARVTFSVDEEGLPIHADAEAEIRPRLFLEGNFFVDLFPGSPSAPDLPDGGDIPVTQTATAVQIDEILTALQQPDRRGLQELLEGYGTGLTYEPTAEDDLDQDPSVQGESAAKSLNDAFVYGGDAGRGAAIVNTALLGENPHDLSRFVKGLGVTFGKLASREDELSDLITNFNVFAGALATESENLSLTIAELAPTLDETELSLRHLNEALPAARALAIVSRPGIQELPQTISTATPWLDQTRSLMAEDELGGLSRLIRDASPGLAETAGATRPLFTEQTALARCTSEVLVPAGDVVIEDEFSTGQPNYREFFYATVQMAGESQGFDGNGPYVRLQSGGGPQLLQAPEPAGGLKNNIVFGNSIEVPTGVQPVIPAEATPPYRPEFACAKNAVPNINGPAAAVGPSDLTAVTP